MKTPAFWYKGGALGTLLSPVGKLYAELARRDYAKLVPQKAPVPVICVGNLVAGGAGKTPVALALAEFLPGANYLSRGYGGSLAGPMLVDPHRHGYAQVGDEPLLLAEAAPCWVSKDRLAGARAAAAHGARCLIMDDGFQNPSLIKDLSLLVIDGAVGFGNGHCIPAGPLREPVERGLARADAIILLGEDETGLLPRLHGLPVLRAVLEPEVEAETLRGETVVAFAGIGRPAKFFDSLEALGARLVGAYSFADHHPYHPNEIAELLVEADKLGAALVTTTKDYVRVPLQQRDKVGVLRITVTWQDEAALGKVLDKLGGNHL